MKNRFYIYGLFYENEEGENICFYIGKGTSRRYTRHLQESRLKTCSNTYKVNKVRKLRRNGKEPFSKIVKNGLTDEQALKLENQILNNDEVFNQVTNLRRGGKGGALDEETKKKMSKAHSGKNHHMYGKSHTEKTKKKMSKAHEGKTVSKKTKKKMSEANKGENNNGNNKLNKKAASEIKSLCLNSDFSQQKIAKKYHVSEATVSMIKNEKLWSHIEV